MMNGVFETCHVCAYFLLVAVTVEIFDMPYVAAFMVTMFTLLVRVHYIAYNHLVCNVWRFI